MIIALFGGDGRAVGTYAAVLIARAAASVGTATTLVRVAGAHESGLPYLGKVPDALRVVELSDAAPSFRADLRREAGVVPAGHLAVIDLPQPWLAAGPVDFGDHAKVVAVGPSPLECSIAAAALRGSPDGGPPWVLACGAASAAAFDRTLRATMAAYGLSDTTARPVGRGLPGPPQLGTTRTGAEPDALSIRTALRVLDVLFPGAVGMPRSPADALAPALLGMGEADRRTSQERLRDLADALDAAEGGEYPSPDDLASAPVLDDWELGMRPVAALVGRVTSHPGFPAGRRIRTSEVYVSDRRTWARTYSRLYRLGRPAGPRPSLQ